MEKILVTGGAGYIGSVLVGKLLNNNYIVTVVDSLMYGQQSLLQYIPNPNFKFVWGDVVDHTDELQQLILDSDFVIPLAAIVGAGATNRCREYSRMVNYLSIFDLVQTCNDNNADAKIIFPTTNSGYGTQSGEVYCTEETLLKPISPYGIQKVDAESFLLNNYKNVITLRLATVFGVSPRMRLDLLVNYTINEAITKKVICVPDDIKDNLRNYIHIRDVSDCFVHCINNFENMKREAYNAGNDDENMSVGVLSKMIADHIGCELTITHHYKDSDKRNYIVSNEKLRTAGFVAKRNIKDEIDNIVKACEIIKMSNYGRSEYKNA
jgi:nucleoside-diphosphate-sugar epimerase